MGEARSLGDRIAARVPGRVQNAIFDAIVRATVASSSRVVSPSAQFAVNELLGRRGLRRYTLRSSGRTLFVRHPVMDAWVVHEVLARGLYAPPPPVERALARREAPRIVDLGAHVGTATLHFLERFPTAQVLAVEPNPQTAALLRRMVAANGLEAQCEVRQAAAGVEPGRAVMEGFSILAHLERADTVEAVDEIPVLRKYQNGATKAEVEIVDILPALRGADLVKMDIEGGEWPILRDPRFAELGIGAVVMEYHPQGAGTDDTAAEVRRLLSAAGLTVGEPFQQHGELGSIWAWRD
jgi:FkbM family methyltransferase